MNVGEFKKLVDELKSRIQLEQDSAEVLFWGSQLTDALGASDDEQDLQSEMMGPIKHLIKEFWTWVSHNLPCDTWQNHSKVMPWLGFQRAFEKACLLDRDFHHPILFQELQNRYDGVFNNQLRIAELLPLLIRASRMIGYAEKGQLDAYPFLKLDQQIAAKRPQEIAKLKDAMVLLRASLYLIHRYCTVEQLDLLPFLIYFRYHTTAEEQRSELAIFNWLTKKSGDSIIFFNANPDLVDMRAIKLIDALTNVTHLIPTTRSEFLKVTHERRWIYSFIQQNRDKSKDSESDLINETLRLLNSDFATHRDKSYSAALDFVAQVKKQRHSLSRDEAKIVHTASYLFCLEQYIKQRREDERPKYSRLSFSGHTKCKAAEKKQLALRGEAVSFGFFESMAVKQGRLNDLIAPMEEQVMSLG
jgi:hypothetical protein